jgi:hypothetical protein
MRAMNHLVLVSALVVTFDLVVLENAASQNGYILLAQGSVPEICTQVYQPVCGTDQNGRRVTYSNACFARLAKATNVSVGECPK